MSLSEARRVSALGSGKAHAEICTSASETLSQSTNKRLHSKIRIIGRVIVQKTRAHFECVSILPLTPASLFASYNNVIEVKTLILG